MDKNRIKLIQDLLKSEEALFVYSPSNVFYLIEKRINGLFLLITKYEIFALVSKMLKSQAEDVLNLKTIVGDTFKDQALQIKKLNIKKIYLDSEDISFNLYILIKKYFSDVNFSQIIKNLRITKSQKEIDKINKAIRITNKVLNETRLFIKEGVTEIQVKNFILQKFLFYDVEASFEPIVAFGKNSAYPHHISDHTKFQSEDIILIDLGCKVNGYCCDITRVYNLNEEARKYYKILVTLQKKLISMCKVNMKVKDIHNYALDFLSQYGIEDKYLHSTGHGLGVDIHEPPFVSFRDKTILKEGMVITIEPGVYFRNKFGLRIEDDILITTSSAKILTKNIK